MAMTACFECKAPISTTAAACPQCGARVVQRTGGNGSGIALLVAGGFAAVLGIFFYSALKTPAPPAKTAEQVKVERAKEAQFQADALKVRALKATLKNPASFDLVSAGRLSDGTLCITYRGTNSFNATTTERTAITASGHLADYNTACAGQSGENVESIRHALGR